MQLPETLQDQLHEFRRRVWTIKIVEAVAAAGFGILVAYLVLFGLDRVVGHARLAPRRRSSSRPRRPAPTSRSACTGGSGGTAGSSSSPGCSPGSTRGSATSCWGSSSWPATNSSRRGRRRCARRRSAKSPSDARAAISATPFRILAIGSGCMLAAVPLAVAVVPAGALPGGGRRMPGSGSSPPGAARRATRSPRSRSCPTTWSSPTASRSRSTCKLTDKTVWRPEQGVAQLGAQAAGDRPARRDGRYEFELPSQIDPGQLHVKIGDASQSVRIEPTLRPELTSIVAVVALPAYLGLPQAATKDVRGGAVSLVQGSQATFTATASRELSAAQVDGQPATPAGATVSSPPALIEGSRKIEFRWQDKLGLAGKEPFTLAITGREDEAPSLTCEDLPRQKVVLDSEQLSFKVRAQDDFGIKRVGIDWQGVETAVDRHSRPRASASWRPAATTRTRSSSPARSRPSRWASSRSR